MQGARKDARECERLCETARKCVRLGVSACVSLKVCNSVSLGAVRGLPHRGGCAEVVWGVGEWVCECARVCTSGGDCLRVCLSASKCAIV